MVTYTLEPWELNRVTLEITAENGTRRIATVAIPGKYGSSLAADCATAEANASLLYASPDLRRFAQEIAALDPQDFDAHMGEALIRRARALVVKADGAT